MYKLINIVYGKKHYNRDIFYAQIEDDKGILWVDATLNYCLDWIKKKSIEDYNREMKFLNIK